MPEEPTRREDAAPREDPLVALARGAGALVSFVGDVAARLAAASQERAAARPFGGYRPTFRPSANPSFTGGLRPSGAEPRLAPAAREPLVDLFDEGDEIAIVVEWPEGDVDQIEVSVEGDVLTLIFGAGAPAVDMLLPAAVDPASLRRQARNGIVEIRLRRA